MEREGMSLAGIGGRFLAALCLVYATYNPEGYSYFHWVLQPMVHGPGAALGEHPAPKVLAGLLLLAGWIFFIKATMRSLGLWGAVLSLALFAGVVWLLIDFHIFSPVSSRAIGHVILIVVSAVLATGMFWSSIKRRLTGQVDTDEVH